MDLIFIFLLILSAFFFFSFGYFLKFSVLDKKVQEVKSKKKTQLDLELQSLRENIDSLTSVYTSYQNQIKDMNKELHNEFRSKRVLLEELYAKKDKELSENYRFKQESLQMGIEDCKRKLQSYQAQEAAIIEAKRREQALKDNPKNYILGLTDDEKHDVEFLNQLRPKLFFPQVVGKIIWSTFIQNKLKALSDKLLDEDKICGIYKITNLQTEECYIGQSVDVRKRWQQHCKEGVGAVSATTRNQLYNAMQEYGISNFTFELLEKCMPDELNQKEAFYIQTYNSNKFGYNQTKGNN